MRFVKPFDIWGVPEHLLKYIKPGQWVYAGSIYNKGQWCGMRHTGSSVVVWYRGDIKGYSAKRKTLMQYARG